MNKSLKAALLSALVFPGAGHFSLKKPVQGALISGVAMVCLYFILNTAVDIAQQISIKIQSGEVPLDVANISEMVSQDLAGSDGQGINMAALLLVICWVVGIADSVRIGWSRGNSQDASNRRA